MIDKNCKCNTHDRGKKRKDKPLVDALAGAKKKVFMDELAGNNGMWDCSCSGGPALTTSAQLGAASTWYTWGNNTDGLIDTLAYYRLCIQWQ